MSPQPTEPFTSDTGGGGNRLEKPAKAPFALIGDEAEFLPTFYPETIRVRRERNPDRTRNYCGGEDVTDNGSKNPEIHLTGRMVGQEKEQFERVIASDEAFEMTSPAKTAEVRVVEGEFEGPVGWNPEDYAYHFEYTIDLVTTGADERDASKGNGIISDGSEED